ncbi:hypothetical protein RGUI_0975 [Rhodovulum sp. P5]|uniref:hypothetical protein n=1 Tax=Rhodovulum sp. P5 TaxID=1564506 RepID=UPI0009C38886|nr:hypothetical protein [Rhodovulum sp. P5]ARE39116.1 hypothetical protein RGUI_0975 [Rhodovulum sp. P5]
MMVQLLFIACTGLSHPSCEERSMIFTDITPMTCVMGAQPELAKWAEEHPNWTVSRWRCGYINTAQKNI